MENNKQSGVSNFKEMMKDSQKRNIYLSVIGIAVLTIVAGIYWSGKKNANIPTGANVAPVPGITAVPGVSDVPQYNKDVMAQNQKRAEDALKDGRGYVPTPVNNDALSVKSPLDELEEKKKKDREEEDRLRKEEEERLRQEAELRLKMEDEQRKAALLQQQRLQAQMQQQQPVNNKVLTTPEDYMLVSTLMSIYATKTPIVEQNYIGQQQNRGGVTENYNAPLANVQSSGVMSGAQADPEPIAPAGTIYVATLETGINSDEPSPVLAKIVTGPLKGMRLIGDMKRSGEKVVVEFSVASVPDSKRSIKLKAVAVDPNSQRTGLATDVDRHYFLKYGVLLGSAFLSGYADAYARQNTTSTVSPLGTVVTQNGGLDNQAINAQAIGSVGRELANQTRNQVANLPPTITVNSGTPIGILLMEDLIVK